MKKEEGKKIKCRSCPALAGCRHIQIPLSPSGGGRTEQWGDDGRRAEVEGNTFPPAGCCRQTIRHLVYADTIGWWTCWRFYKATFKPSVWTSNCKEWGSYSSCKRPKNKNVLLSLILLAFFFTISRALPPCVSDCWQLNNPHPHCQRLSAFSKPPAQIKKKLYIRWIYGDFLWFFMN